jgi:hypothetical protein
MRGDHIGKPLSPRGSAAVPPFLRKLASLASAAILVLALSFAIVWPLWSLATKERRAYTIAILASLGLALAFAAARSIARVLAARRRRARARRSDP